MPPEIAVVVPSHNRPDGLARLLTALDAQTLDPARWEAVVVDDGSHPPQRVARGRSDIRIVRKEVAAGPAAARNTGWRATSAPTVAFIDDDCFPAPGWLAAILEAVGGQNDDYVVQGPVRPPDGSPPQTPLTHAIEVPGPSRLFVSCNIAFSRSLLERTGGFDEWFTRACGEDVELGARATGSGATVAWADGALVFHEVRHVGLVGALRQTSKWTDAVRVIALHPELRDLLTLRLFWKPTHPLLLLALAGVATRRPGLVALACLPYLRTHRRGHATLAGTAKWLPVHLVIDVWEIGTALTGTARHRTLML